jgi:hypothetical protein
LDDDDDYAKQKERGRWTTPTPMQISGTKGVDRERQWTKKPMKGGDGKFLDCFGIIMGWILWDLIWKI